MINDALKLTVDQIFLPNRGQSHYDPTTVNVFNVPEYENNENMW